MSNPEHQDSIRRRALVPREDCPMAQAAEFLGDRWTLLILREAFYGVQRYDDMLTDLKAPRSMLSNRLGKLVEKGLMNRRPYREPNSRVRYAYVLTEAGQALAPVFIALTHWGEKHLGIGESPVKIIERASGDAVRLCLQNSEGKEVDIKSLMLTKR